MKIYISPFYYSVKKLSRFQSIEAQLFMFKEEKRANDFKDLFKKKLLIVHFRILNFLVFFLFDFIKTATYIHGFTALFRNLIGLHINRVLFCHIRLCGEKNITLHCTSSLNYASMSSLGPFN